MANIGKRLAGHSVIGLDTAILIYHFEAHPHYLPLTTIVLNGIQNGQWRANVSVIALMELTVYPWKQNRPMVARKYEALLVNFPHLSLIDATRSVARKAAQLRATYNLRPADALHIASALTQGASAFITNDKHLNRLSQLLDIVILDEFLLGGG